jgi:sarcosine oxidase subunit beta
LVYDLVVIGGGVWGTAAALTAQQARFGRVLLVEANPYVGGESSGKSGGIVGQLVWHPDDQVWVARSRAMLEHAEASSGDRTMIQRYGGLVLCSSDEARQLIPVVESLRQRGISLEFWDRAQVAARFPLIDGLPADMVAVWSPEDWHVNPTAYAQATLAEAREMGLFVRLGYRVTAIELGDRRVRLEGPDGGLEAKRVLVAAGTWTRKLLQSAGADIAYRPYRVQLASLHFAESHALPILSETATDMYITPDGPTNLLAGDGTQLWEHDPDAYRQEGDPEFEQDIAAGVMRLISRAQHAALRRSWAGLCGATPDRRPLLGAVAEGLYIACGDNGYGVVRGPALGELAARVAMGEAEAPQLDPHRFPPGDFVLRPGSGGILPDTSA